MDSRHPPVSRLRSSRGTALVSTLCLLMILSGLAAAMTTNARLEMLVARNTVSSAQAEAAAEAGLNHAVDLVISYTQQFGANGFPDVGAAMTDLLLGPDGVSGTVATDADNGSLENQGIPRPPTPLALAGIFGVTYEARIFDDDDPARGLTLTAADLVRIGEDGDPTTDANSIVVVQAIGYAPDNTQVTLESTLTAIGGAFAGFRIAVVTGGDLVINGNPTIIGSQGGVHANVDMEISGSPSIQTTATASDSYSVSGNPDIGGFSGGGYDLQVVPEVRAIDYRTVADYILTSGGVVTTQGGTPICDASGDNDACKDLYGWTFDDPGWKLGANNGADGTYYVEGPATISGNPGSAAHPLALTLIAEGSIQISGNPHLTPETPELMFVTDGDLKINGFLRMPLTVEGLMLVHEQLMISGNSTLSGQLIVEDAEDNSSLVHKNTISGNSLISYNGTIAAGGGGGGVAVITVTAWREVK